MLVLVCLRNVYVYCLTLTCIITISLLECWCLCTLETYSVTKCIVCSRCDTFVMTLHPTTVCLSLSSKYWSLCPGFVLHRSRCCWFILFPSSLPTWRWGRLLQLLSEQRIVENILRSSLQTFLPIHLIR